MTAIYSTIDNIEVMSKRLQDCYLTAAGYLSKISKHSTESSEFWAEVIQFKFLCIPRVESLEKVKIVNDHAAFLKDTFELLGTTLFKIPRHVNDIERYVAMLLREHFKR